jgi:hypothetical protein
MMKSIRYALYCCVVLSLLVGCTKTENAQDAKKPEQAQSTHITEIPVNFSNVVRAESNLMFKQAIERANGVNKFHHTREAATQHTQLIVRSQSDMLYSHGVFDASKQVTVKMPDLITGYHSVHIFDANHAQIAMAYANETITITPDMITTEDKHVYMLMRTSVANGLEAAHKSQDSVVVTADSDTPYQDAKYSEEQLKFAKRFMAGINILDLLKGQTASYQEIDTSKGIPVGDDLVSYQYIATSLLGWGLMPNAHAYYIVTYVKGTDCGVIEIDNPPLQYDNSGYWSLTAYGFDGYLRTEKTAISITNAIKNEAGGYSIWVGNTPECRSKPNYLDMPEGGASLVLRMYRPTSVSEAKAYEKKVQEVNNK